MIFSLLVGTIIRGRAADEPYKAQIDALRKAMEKYKDYKVAVPCLYLSTVGCVYYSGEKMPDHMEYPKGAMGVHFVDLTIRGAPDPMKPNVLIYEPVGKELAAGGGRVARSADAGHKERPVALRPYFHGPDGGP